MLGKHEVQSGPTLARALEQISRWPAIHDIMHNIKPSESQQELNIKEAPSMASQKLCKFLVN